MKKLLITTCLLISIAANAGNEKVCQVDAALDPLANVVKLYLYEAKEQTDIEFVSQLLGIDLKDKKCHHIVSALKNVKQVTTPQNGHSLEIVLGCSWTKAQEKAIAKLGQGITNLFSTSGSIINKSGKIEFGMSFQKEDQHFISKVIVVEASCVVESFNSTVADEISLN